MTPINIRLLLFGIVCPVTVYLFSAMWYRKFKKVHLSRALLYICSVAMIGVLGEISVDSFYNHFFHYPLWQYNFLPVHNGYTSEFSIVLWGSFGFYIYLLHHKYEKWTRQELINLALIFSLEAIAIEAIADIVSKFFLGKYIYYYYPSNLWHISAFQNIPFYFLSGVVIIETIHWFKASPHYFTIISSWVLFVTVYIQ
jgi:hypothetical protein